MDIQLSRRARFVMVAPGLAALAVLVVLPVTILVWLSVMDRHTYEASGRFIAGRNYETLLADAAFWRSARFTAVYTFWTVALQLAAGMVGALALNRFRRFAGPLLAVLLLPYVLPTAVVAFIWRWMLEPSIGIVNAWGAYLGLIPRDFGWLTRDHLFITLVLVGTWQFFPFVLLLIYARLVSIPRVRYEAAAADGYGPVRTFYRVTLPELVPLVGIVALLRGLFMATKFDAIWLLGGQEAVGRWAQALPVLSYQTTFEAQDAGMGAAISVGLLAVLLVTVGAVLGVVYVRKPTV